LLVLSLYKFCIPRCILFRYTVTASTEGYSVRPALQYPFQSETESKPRPAGATRRIRGEIPEAAQYSTA
jgi:hypothetical protein